MKIPIDSFFGQNDLANLPVQERSIEKFPVLWSRYDPYAKGFIPIEHLENLLIDMANDEDTKELVMFHKEIIDTYNEYGYL